jgi:hypothetical protein
MHFNKQPDAPENDMGPDGTVRIIKGLLAIDTVVVDEHSRLTITKRIKRFLPIETQDVLAFYKDPGSGDIILQVQRSDEIVHSWLIRTNHKIQ